MPSIKNWWTGEINWATPAGRLLEKFLATLPRERHFRLTLFGSAPLQLTVDRQLMSGDVDLFADNDDEDLPNRHAEIDVRREIIEPAITRRNQGYGESPPDYKSSLGQ
jgi:hypothetical protein